MAEVKKARLFLRRGTDTDRKTTTLCEGELGYSTDAFRVVVGNGTTAGGISLGTTVFVSGGVLSPHFHTNLSEASAGGFAHTGDLAVFPAQSYFKADGATVSTPGVSASTVMVLTGSTADVGVGTSWVSVNSGIPWGNLHVQADDITGDYVSGGDISGDVTFSGTISTTSLTGTSAFIGSLGKSVADSTTRPVVVTSTGQLTATGATAAGGSSAVIADGSLKFLTAFDEVVNVGSVTYTDPRVDWTQYNLTSNSWGGPADATHAVVQCVGKNGTSSTTYAFIKLRPGQLNARIYIAGVAQAGAATASQIVVPLSAAGGNLYFDYFVGYEGSDDIGFSDGYSINIVGYM